MSLIPGRTPPQKRAAKLIMKAMLEDRNKAIQGAEKRMVDKGGHQFTDAELAGLSPEDKARVLNSQAARYGDMEETVGEMFDPNVQGLARATATVPGPTRVKAEKVLTDRHKGIGDRLMQAVTSNTGKKRGDVVEMVKEMRLTRQKEAEVNYKRAHRASPPQNADELVQPIIETRVGKTAAKKAINLLDRQLALETDPYVKSQIKQDIQYLEAFTQGPGSEAAAPTKELDNWMDALDRARKPIKEPERLASFVRRFGGVRDDRGELKALESTGLRNKNSRYTINEMREMAIEQRFVRPDADDNDFLAAVFEDYKGNPEIIELAERVVTLLRGVKGFKDMGGQVHRGMLLSDYGRHVLLPEQEFANFQRPAPFIPPSKGHWAEWIHACKTGDPTTCNFEYAGCLTEANHLGNLAFRLGKKLEWDADALRCTNAPEADPLIHRDYRTGWHLA